MSLIRQLVFLAYSSHYCSCISLLWNSGGEGITSPESLRRGCFPLCPPPLNTPLLFYIVKSHYEKVTIDWGKKNNFDQFLHLYSLYVYITVLTYVHYVYVFVPKGKLYPTDVGLSKHSLEFCWYTKTQFGGALLRVKLNLIRCVLWLYKSLILYLIIKWFCWIVINLHNRHIRKDCSRKNLFFSFLCYINKVMIIIIIILWSVNSGRLIKWMKKTTFRLEASSSILFIWPRQVFTQA